MRKRLGISALQKDQQRKELFQQKGSSLAKEELEKLSSQMNEFRENLEKFASKYKKEIKRSGEFRQYFQQMCASSGVDPLRSSSSYWSKLLGFGDFYYQLAIQINEVFIPTSQSNGGIISIEELLKRVNSSRHSNKSTNSSSYTDSVTHHDILESIKKLSSLGSYIKVIPSGNSYVIHSTPSELNSDQLLVAQLASKNNGCVSQSGLFEEYRWSIERTQKVFNELIMEGIVWIDTQDSGGEPLYWIPSLR